MDSASAAPDGVDGGDRRKSKGRRHVDTQLEWLKAIGMPAVTLFVTMVGGYYLTGFQKEREARESNQKLYAQLLTQREQSDAQIRKDMFNLVIGSFMQPPKKGDIESQVLQLELLATNFNQSLDIAPLFKDVARNLVSNASLPAALITDLKKRLDSSASNLISKQVDSLAQHGFSYGIFQPLRGWEDRIGTPIIDQTVPLNQFVPATAHSNDATKGSLHVHVEIVDLNLDHHEVMVRLRIEFSDDATQNIDRHFWVSQYDFPMLDNTQLAMGLRCSVVITDFLAPTSSSKVHDDNVAAYFNVVIFPAASASFKERQDYDDVLNDMLKFGGKRSRNGAGPS